MHGACPRILLLALAGCSSGAPHAGARTAARGRNSHVATSVSSQRVEPRAEERAHITLLSKLKLPLVRVHVQGHPTLALLDTGATANLLSKRFAETAGAKTELTSNEAVDHMGKPFRLLRVRSPLRVEGFAHDEKATLFAAELPVALHDLGVGAILAPTLLSSSGEALTLDFNEGSLVRTKGAKVSGANTLHAERLCVDDSGGALYGVSAMLGKSLVRLLIDTGADRTDVFLESKEGKTLLPLAGGARSATIATGEARATTVPDIDVRVGAWKWTLDIDLVAGSPDPQCARQGVLGMDALVRCRLRIEAGELTMVCS